MNNHGIPGFFDKPGGVPERGRLGGGGLRALTEAWWATFGTSEVTTAKLLPLVTDHGIELHLKGDDDHALVQSLGSRLARQRGKVYGDLKIERNARTRGWVLSPSRRECHRSRRGRRGQQGMTSISWLCSFRSFCSFYRQLHA